MHIRPCKTPWCILLIFLLDLDDIGHGFLANILTSCVTIFVSGQRGIALILYISRSLIEILIGLRPAILIEIEQFISIETAAHLVVRNYSESIICHWEIFQTAIAELMLLVGTVVLWILAMLDNFIDHFDLFNAFGLANKTLLSYIGSIKHDLRLIYKRHHLTQRI